MKCYILLCFYSVTSILKWLVQISVPTIVQLTLLIRASLQKALRFV